MALTAGTRLGAYEILAPLGAGGMGEVYRARDTKLGRDVAVKVLPADSLANESARRHLRKEAAALARLSHPHIAILHDLDSAAGIDFIVMELVPGPTLKERLRDEPLTEREVVRLGTQLLRGLAAAHERGIVHRDLKPSNISLTEDGLLKILDFGLAHLEKPAPSSLGKTGPTETVTGKLVGTLPYMSPEQVRGQRVDPRSDLYGVGAVLFTLLTRRRPFGDRDGANLIDAILHEPATSPRSFNSGVSSGLETIILKALDKDPGYRYQTAREMLVDLERLERGSTGDVWPSGPSRSAAPRRSRGATAGAAAVLAIALGALGWWWLDGRGAGPPPEPLTITPFTADGGRKSTPQLSPDGEKVAYGWTGPSSDNWDIYVKAQGLGAAPLRLTDDPAADTFPTWSPDGRQVAFLRRFADDTGALYTVPSMGGRERKLTDVRGLMRAWGDDYWVPVPHWSPDGGSLVYAEKVSESEPSRIVRLSLETLEKETLTSPTEGSPGDFYPALSPDGTQLAFGRSSSLGEFDVWVQPVKRGPARQLTSGEYYECFGLAWTPDGRDLLYSAFSSGSVLIFRVSVAGGEPQPTLGAGRHAAGASVRGRHMVYEQQTIQPWDIWRVPTRAASPRDRVPVKLVSSSGEDFHPAYSPDGRRLAFESNRSGQRNIWVSDADGSRPVRLTSFESQASSPRWSPDGRRLAFCCLEPGDWNVYVVDAEGGVPRRVTREPATTPGWSPDGRWLFFGSNRTGRFEVWKRPLEGGEAVQVTQNGGAVPTVSRDGRYLYYSRSQSPSGIWRLPLGGGEETEVVRASVDPWEWALGRSGVYYATNEAILPEYSERYVVRYRDFESGEVKELYRKEGPFAHISLAVSPDEEWIVFGELPGITSELMLVENFR